MTNATLETGLTTAFETETCSRCAGSGQYSYCQSYGTTCFKCRGKGRTYTKRAETALAWAKEQRTVRADAVQVGWLLYESASPLGGKTGWFPVTSCGLTNSQWTSQDGRTGFYWDVSTDQCSHHTFAESPVQAVPTRERLKEIRAMALEYQTGLTKAGTVRKRVVA